MTIKHDNCQNCRSRCIHAGKDRDFVCINGVSCKITTGKSQTNAVTVQEWISVEDRLPEPWKQVLIYSRYDFCESAFYIGVPGKWRVTWNHEMLDADSVTHWMPMPQPPKGE